MATTAQSFALSKPRPVSAVVHSNRLPKVLWLFIAAVGVASSISPDREVGWYGTAILWLVSKLLWRSGQPQTLFFISFFQWCQSFGPVLQGLLDGRPYAVMMGHQEMETAIWLSLTAVGVLAMGLKLTSWRSEPVNGESSLRGLAGMNDFRLFLGWLFASVAASAVEFVAGFSGGITQAFGAVVLWKWAMILLIFYRWLSTGKGALMAVSILLFESAIGMLGIFSAFKTVFFLLIIAGTGIVSLSKSRASILAFMGIALIVITGFWQVVKGHYRSFMSQGERAQVITVSVADRVAWMEQAVDIVGVEHLQLGWQEALRRISYVDFFGYAIKTVPQVVPHTDGLLWKEAILHALQPRIFFPNKPVLDDSVRTNTYCGISVSGAEEGTSISIGYFGESYIDFGEIGMFAPIFLWGGFLGWMYHWLRKNAGSTLLGLSLGTGLLLIGGLFLETSNSKMFGGIISAFIGLVISTKLFGRAIWYWLLCGDKRKRTLLSGRGANARS